MHAPATGHPGGPPAGPGGRLGPVRRLVGFVAGVAAVSGLLAVPGVLPEPAPDPLPAPSAAPLPAPSPAPVRVAQDAAAAAPPAGDPSLTAADVRAGLLSSTVPPAGTGTTTVVPGTVPAPGPGPVRTVRVEVEGGVPVEPSVFAAFAVQGLNDPRSWGRGGAMSFARTDGDAEIVVVLASPATAQRLCAGLDTGGTLSCRVGDRAVITHYRWVLAHPDYGDDRTGYRRYVVNHEVGHVLGYDHVPCPGPGVPAPVMMQQTKGLLGCAPNPWPFP